MTEVSWARLWTPAGVADQSIPANNSVDASWYNFMTNDSTVFATNVGTTYPYNGETNTSGDTILKVLTYGIFLMEFFVKWPNGTYNRYVDIGAGGFNQLDARGSTVENRWQTSEFDFETYYSNYVCISIPNFTRFLMYNGSASSKTITDRGVSIVKIPTVDGSYTVFA